MKHIITIFLLFSVFACQELPKNKQAIKQKAKAVKNKVEPILEPVLMTNQKHFKLIQPDGKTIATRIDPPEGFERVKVAPNSFADYLRNLPVKPDGSPVLHYDGSQKMKNVHVAVIDMDVGTADLQQCADAFMRMRAEHLFAQKKYEDIHFNFTNGFRVDYSKWRAGYRMMVKGNKSWWEKKTGVDGSYATFRKYMNQIFMYAGSLSLSKEMKKIDPHLLKAGDVFVKGGTPGHLATVMDVAVNPQTGETIFLLSQSYMPAQDIHILRNERKTAISPWFPLDFGEELHTPEFIFHHSELMRFP